MNLAKRGSDSIYLDNAATTRPFPEVVRAMVEAMESNYGNPSSRHGLGLKASELVEAARAAVARAIGSEPREVVFTGGGSEANNLALKGVAWAYARAGRHLVVSTVEHPSVLETTKWLASSLGFEVTLVPVGPDGRVSAEAVGARVTEDTVLVGVMHVNNEVGAVEPVAEIGRLLRATRAVAGRRRGLPLFHVDAAQSLGRVPVDVRAWGADLVTLSAHKVHGPKGVGALFVRDGVRLTPAIHGGGHEAGRRSGTENVPGVAGFAAALNRLEVLGLEETASRLGGLRRQLIAGVRRGWPGVVLNGPEGSGAAPHILSLSFPGLPAEVMQHHLERRGVFVSTGSACSSLHRGRPSHVLRAMGRPAAVVASAVRLSLSALTTAGEVERAAEAIVAAAKELAGPEPPGVGAPR